MRCRFTASGIRRTGRPSVCVCARLEREVAKMVADMEWALKPAGISILDASGHVARASVILGRILRRVLRGAKP